MDGDVTWQVNHLAHHACKWPLHVVIGIEASHVSWELSMLCIHCEIS